MNAVQVEMNYKYSSFIFRPRSIYKMPILLHSVLKPEVNDYGLPWCAKATYCVRILVQN